MQLDRENEIIKFQSKIGVICNMDDIELIDETERWTQKLESERLETERITMETLEIRRESAVASNNKFLESVILEEIKYFNFLFQKN